MKKRAILLFLSVMASCNSKIDRSQAFVPESSGNLNHVTVVMPESDWNIHVGAAFILYYLFPNITLIVGNGTCTLVKIYPSADNPGRSTSQIFAYYSQEMIDQAQAARTEGAPKVSAETVYDFEQRGPPSFESTMEVFSSTIEKEDYLMGELQQKSAQKAKILNRDG